MNKLILMASALALGGVAHAQTMTPPATDASTPAGTSDGSMQQGATPDASAPQGMAPDGSAPPAAPDASTVPAGQDGTMPPAAPDASAPSSAGAGPGASAQSSGDLPVCSKSVTDNCKEGRGAGTRHATSHRRRHR